MQFRKISWIAFIAPVSMSTDQVSGFGENSSWNDILLTQSQEQGYLQWLFNLTYLRLYDTDCFLDRKIQGTWEDTNWTWKSKTSNVSSIAAVSQARLDFLSIGLMSMAKYQKHFTYWRSFSIGFIIFQLTDVTLAAAPSISYLYLAAI